MPKKPTESSLANRIRTQTGGLWTQSISVDLHQEFGQTYFDDPVGFVENCIIWGPGEGATPYQKEIMRNLVENKRACVRGPHGLGKTGLSSWIVLWFALTRDATRADWKVPTTASAWRQLNKFLWPEIHKWSSRINWLKIGRDELRIKEELMGTSLSLNFGQAFALASNRSDLIEGAHADHMLYLFDESKVIPEPTWDSAEGAMTGENSLWLSVSTPGEPNGRFYTIQTRARGYEDWWVRHVKLDEVLEAGRVTQSWVDARRNQWGEESAMFQNRVLGEFAYEESDTLIPLHWVEAAVERWYTWKKTRAGLDELHALVDMDQVGVDVARMGGDDTVFAKRYGLCIDELQKYGKLDTMQVVGFLVPILKHAPNVLGMIDVVGVGAGVYDRMYEQFEERVMPFHPQEKTLTMDRAELWEFADCYSAAWWHLRELLDPTYGSQVCLPPDNDLIADLTAPKWSPQSNGKIKVERKEDVKKRLDRSPDSGDAVVLAFWNADNSGIDFF
jgi:hypothetical protein